MPALIVQIADDVPEEAIDRLYRQITALPLVTGAMPITVDLDSLRDEIQNFLDFLTTDERRRLGLD